MRNVLLFGNSLFLRTGALMLWKFQRLENAAVMLKSKRNIRNLDGTFLLVEEDIVFCS